MYHNIDFAKHFLMLTPSPYLLTTNMHNGSKHSSSSRYTALLTTCVNFWTRTHYFSTAPQHMPRFPMPHGCYLPSPLVQLQCHPVDDR